MKFKTKLYSGLILILVLLTVFLIILLRMDNQETIKTNEIVSALSERKSLTATLQYEIANMGREISEIASPPSKDTLSKAINEWEQSRLAVDSSIEELNKLDNDKETQGLIAKLYTFYKPYEDTGEQIIFYQKTKQNINAQILLNGEALQNREQMQQIANSLLTLQDQAMKDQLLRTRQTYSAAQNFIYGYLIISLFVVIGIALFIIKGLTKNLNQVTAVMSNLASKQGEQLPRIEVTTKDEIGSIAIAYNKMAHALETKAKHEKALIKHAEEQSWLKSKVAEITSLYAAAEDFQTLAKLFVNKITPLVGAQYGVLYIRKESEEQQLFEKTASYATLHGQKALKRVRSGEGLIGQCAAEKKPIILSDLPEDYVKISSGSGFGTPKNIYILPAEYEGEVLAVLEVATFKTFNKLQQELLTEVMGHIGITVHSIGNRVQVKKLLLESQALTGELQSQSEELQLQQEELRTINEELEEQYKKSEQKKEEFERISIMLEEKAQELTLTSQYKTEFLANMSHELRTPLNSMLILAQMLLEKRNENLSSKQLDYIQTIYSSGNDLLHLINEVLDLAKVEAGKIEVVADVVYLENIKSFVEGYFTPLARQKDLKFHLSFDENLPKTIYTDEHRLHQILRNLLSNAYKFTEKGSIWLIIQPTGSSEKKIPAPDNQVESSIKFTVVDTGIGIPKEKLQMIFGAFVQADGTTSRKYGGTGLGLSISQEIAHLLGGCIEVTSEAGVGSSFTLFLPITQTEADIQIQAQLLETAAAAENLERSPFESIGETANFQHEDEEKNRNLSLVNGKRILIVDDDMRNIFALSAALEEYEIEVLFAENGKEGIAMLLENPDIDLVMMDIMMPEMDGFAAMKKIRSISAYEELPIIAITAKAMKHNREQCIEAGASDYISKPVDLDQLFSLLQVWLY